MKRIAFYLSLVLVVLVLASCKKGQKNLFTPTSSGRPYEVLVVEINLYGIVLQDVHCLMYWIPMCPDCPRRSVRFVYQMWTLSILIVC